VKLQVYIAYASQLELHWRHPAMKRFSRLEAALLDKGRQVRFVTNAGIYEPGCIPSGLHVQAGQQIRPINLVDGEGNFFLKPNGVFYIDRKKRAGILESSRFADSAIQPWLAVQSGPLLLSGGKVHPGFSPNSRHRRHRNGVGVQADGKLVFACTVTEQKTFITLHEFARFFREQGCADSLFLDGDLSRMIVDPEKPIRVRNVYAAIFAITEAAE
jgi:uncharacterized protein YigE (DUF2233 family)